MTIEHSARAYRLAATGQFRYSPHRRTARYETELARQQNRLRESLVREETLHRQNDELVQQQEVLSKLFAHREDAAGRVANLTPRQRQIMELVLAGHPSKNIAADLGISRRTVENHRAAIMKRIGAKSIPALARLALAAAWNGDDGSLVQPLAKLALDAAWNDADQPPVQRKSLSSLAGR